MRLIEQSMPSVRKRLLVGVAGVLAAAIAVMQQLLAVGRRDSIAWRSASRDQLRGQRVADRPTDDLAAEQVDHHGQVDPTGRGRQVGDVGHPFAVGRVGREVAIEHVGRRRLRRIGLRGGRREMPCETRLFRPISRIACGHRVAAGRLQVVALVQLLGDLVAAVNAVRLGMHLPHRRLNPRVTLAARTRRPLERRRSSPRSRRSSTSHITDDRKRVAMFTDPGVFHSDSFAKYAVAFFRISRSSSARLSCLRSRLFSSRSSSTEASSPHGSRRRSKLRVPDSQALLAHAHRLRGRLERIASLRSPTAPRPA